MSVDTETVEKLEREIQRLNRTVIGLQNELLRASRYNHPDLSTRVEGVQTFLARAGEYKDNRKRGARG